MESNRRRLPLGVQHFEELRKGGYLYVDKTDMVWELANGVKYNYLSRPRRFGKSLLADTLKCYFEGKRELFDGLKIMDIEQEWVKHPVLHFDMSKAGSSTESLQQYLRATLAEYECLYQKNNTEESIASRFAGIIHRAYKLNGKGVVILIDEYDSPVRNTFDTPEHDSLKNVYRDFLTVLKSEGDYLKYVFITGIAKFTQLSLFSALNTLENWSFNEKYDTICGLTDEEIDANFTPEMEVMAEKMGMTVAMLRQKLKDMYDGYHFSDRMIDMYNPTSVLKALSRQEMECFWASDGASVLLPATLKENNVDCADLESLIIDRDILRTSDYLLSSPGVFLYQLGYLTLKRRESNFYILGFPNFEVQNTISKIVLPDVVALSEQKRNMIYIRMKRAMSSADVETMMLCLKQLVASKPYTNNSEDRLSESDYQFIFSTILTAANYYVEQEVTTAVGRIDMVCKTRNYIYLMEFKMKENGGLPAAIEQISNRHYADIYSADERPVIALAIELLAQSRTISDWQQVED